MARCPHTSSPMTARSLRAWTMYYYRHDGEVLHFIYRDKAHEKFLPAYFRSILRWWRWETHERVERQQKYDLPRKYHVSRDISLAKMISRCAFLYAAVSPWLLRPIDERYSITWSLSYALLITMTLTLLKLSANIYFGSTLMVYIGYHLARFWYRARWITVRTYYISAQKKLYPDHEFYHV